MSSSRRSSRRASISARRLRSAIQASRSSKRRASSVQAIGVDSEIGRSICFTSWTCWLKARTSSNLRFKDLLQGETAMSGLKIGGLAERTGTNAPTIRYYEEIGLLPRADRQDGGQRRYGVEDVKRLTLIRRCRDFG